MLFIVVTCIAGAESTAESKTLTYHLYPRDLVRVTVFNEPDMNVERRLDAAGAVTLPMLGELKIGGLTVMEAQKKIVEAYVSQEIYINPEVAISIIEYQPREVSVLGQVKDPGKIKFPNEGDALEIVDVISKAGGITRIGKSDSVRVTRKNGDGTEETFTVNVERMFDGRGGAKSFVVLPGDVIFVPERVL